MHQLYITLNHFYMTFFFTERMTCSILFLLVSPVDVCEFKFYVIISNIQYSKKFCYLL